MSLPEEAKDYLTEWIGEGWTAEPLAGDVSVRAYFRVRAADGRSYILAWYPQEVRSQLARFLGAYSAISEHAPVPEVVQSCDAAVLQHDVGDQTLFTALQEDRERGVALYRAAVDLIVEFQRSEDAGLNPPFSAEFFERELEMTREFYVEKLMGVRGDALRPFFHRLCENVSQHPYVLCHRDYHGHNIHIADDTLFVIDYQDLRMGPDTYDLASLLRDRGVASILGEAAEMELVEHYRQRIGAGPDLIKRYWETLLQRSIKILGTFARAPIERGRMHYLDFIPGALDSVRRCLAELPEHAAIAELFPFGFSPEKARERARELNLDMSS